LADLRDLIEAHPDGISRPDLYELARARINPDLTPAQFSGELERIGDLVQDGDLLRLPQAVRGDTETPPPRGLRRLVAVDLETVLRYTEQRPEGERTIFQVGAVRFGPDAAWAASAPPFDRFVRLSDDLVARIVRDDLREAIARDGEDPAAVLADLLDYLEAADAIVAYNGRAFDFPLLDEALARVGAEVPPGIRRIDGLYLALAVWPVPPRRHALSRLINDARLDEVKARLEVDLTGLVAHDAADDARMLADLIRFAAAEVETWPTDLASLVRSIGRESDAWVALFGFLASPPPVAVFDAIDVRATIGAAIGSKGKTPLRQPATPGVPDFSALAGPGGIDLGRLVGASLGAGTPVRDSQTEMLTAMRAWIADGHDALVEAPTGTGKTFVLLAAALDWLAADPANRVVISTYTRALQTQLARAIYRLHEAGVVPGLIDTTSLAKGAANRLSLAGLVRSLADASDPARVARRGDVVGQTGFAELAIYLASRLVAQGSPIEEWEAHSVDPVDIEPFFGDYLAERRGRPSRRGLYLRYLSQAEAGDYRANESSPAEHTSTVREVLDRHRLLVTNHALLLAHLDDFPAPDRTLLIVDESHSLEGAVTDALSARLDWALVEEAHAEARDWIRPPAGGSPPDDVQRYDWLRDMFRSLDDLLDGETVPRSASRLFDVAAGREPLHRDALRVVTLASPFNTPVPPRTGFIRTLEDVAYRLERVATAIAGQPHRADRLEEERREALVDRFNDLAVSARRIADDLVAIVDPPDPTAPPSNRVVWLDERDRHGSRERGFRFRVTSSPVELGREPRYRTFQGAFARTYYLSATLRVDRSFAFIRERLALDPASVREVALDTPFDLRRQARLVCLADFPSWSEQEAGAIASVAQQVGRFLAEAANANRNGAMVLTTSRKAANRIYERLIEVRGSLGREYPISSAGYLGTASAVDVFKERGGAIVGTKGLWQGIDVDEPDRLRLVWVNKLPFAPFNDPVTVARREVVRAAAEAAGEADPDTVANERYYLPLAAMDLRQGVGRLVRSVDHRGVVVISDRRLAGPTRLHRAYRQIFLGSLEGLVVDDEVYGPGGGNIAPMAEAWRRIWSFLAEDPTVLSTERAAALSSPAALDEHTLLPSVRAVRDARLSDVEIDAARGDGSLPGLLAERAAVIASLLREKPTDLHDYQREALDHLAAGRDVLAILPTSAGKSYLFQLPALALPGVTVVVSPLVALMTDQALALNRTAGGMVRALVAPMRESNSRTGKAEVAAQLTGEHDYGIRIVYVSPERLCQAQFQRWIEKGVEAGIVKRMAIDEAHTFATWGEDFRPALKRAERFLERLRAHPNRPRLIALTATATPAVRTRLRRAIFGLAGPDPARLAEVTRSPIRPELALYRRMLAGHDGGPAGKQALLEALVDSTAGHTIVYALTIKEVRTIHAALLEHLGEAEADRVRMFHGRLTSAEKEAVARDFADAPGEDDENFRSMIVVATAAFGLGVDRRDIRTVIVASPPADLAALYQEIGRAGRDKADSTGIMLATGRSFRTLAFMAGRRRQLDPIAVARIAGPILDGDGPLDIGAVALELLEEDVVTGLVRPEEADSSDTIGQYRNAVVRVLAGLAEDDLVEDRGDFPEVVRVVVRDDSPSAEADQARFLAAVTTAIEVPDAVRIVDLATALAPIFGDEVADPADLWVRLLELHSLGYFDVRQQPPFRQLASVIRRGATLPAGFADRFISTLATEERSRLTLFFSPGAAKPCVNDDFRVYFEEPDLPPGTCGTDRRLCSGCWRAGKGSGATPALLAALTDARARPKPGENARLVQSRITRHVRRLLRIRRTPLGRFLIEKTLRGDDPYWSPVRKQMVPLWPELANSAVFGAIPALRRVDLDAVLAVLVAVGEATLIENDHGSGYRLSEQVAADVARGERVARVAAARAAQAAGGPP
jgi:ATP-dependent DNA helicase RecQ